MKKVNWKNGGILILIIIISTLNIYSNEVSYNREEQTGLSFLYVTDIIKDHNGFMWFGTAKGLNRWDGYNYKHYLSNKNDSTSISSNRVQSIILTKNNLIWVGTSNGLNLLNTETEQFIHFFHNQDDSSSISSNNILYVEEDKNGNIWIGTDNGLDIFNIESNTFQKIDYLKSINAEGNYNKILYLYCDSKNVINVGFEYSGLLRIDANNFKTDFIIVDKDENYINSVMDIIQTDSDNLLLGTWGGKAFNYSISQNKAEKWKGNHLLKKNVIDHLEIDKDGNYWISEKYNQLLHISPDLKILDRYSASSEINFIPSNQISCAFTSNDNIWFGTLNYGYFQIRYSQKPIRTFNWETFNLPDINSDQITSIANGRPGEILFGTSNNEIIIYNEKRNSIKRIPTKNKIAYRIFYDDYRKKIFYGSYASSFNSININTFEEKIEVKYDSDYTQLGIASNDSLVFITTWGNGLNILHNNGEVEKQGSTQMELYFSALNLTLDKDILWLATNNNGLLKFDLKTKKFNSYLLQNLSSSILATNQVMVITRLKNGKLLLGTNELGLCYFNQEKEEFIPVGKEIGINNINVKSILEDSNQNIWIISGRKVFKTDSEFSKLSEYTIFDGVNYGIEHLASALNFETNQIYIGGQEGVQYFNTDDLVQDTTTCKVVITGFKVFGKELNLKNNALNGKSISYLDSITLSHKQNFITIDFSSMQFNKQTNRNFSYKLSGVNNGWIVVPNYQNSVTYSNLSSGNYLFEVKVSNEHGIWNDDSTKLNIIITPPFWLTSWFRFIILVSIITITVTFIRLREYSLIQDKKKLEVLVRDRTSELLKQKSTVESQNKELESANHLKNKFFNIIAHDLKNPVGSMVQLTDLLKENFAFLDKDQLEEIINTVSKSANSTMDLLEDLLVWASSQTNKINYNFQPINIYSLVKTEELNLIQQAKNKNISILNEVHENVNVVADSNTIKTVIRNLLSNAIKFSNDNSSIKIQSKIESSFFKLSIIDSGVGIPYTKLKRLLDMDEKTSTLGTAGEKGTGLGLSLCNEFIKRNGGEFIIDSILNEGSEFSFTIPLATES